MKRDTPKYIVEIAKDLRKEQTFAEKILWEKLRGKRLDGFKFRRQYAIGRYIADFYCCEAAVAIEVDGKIHDINEKKEYDNIRQKEIETRGIKVIRFTNYQIYHEIDYVIKIISELLDGLQNSKL